MELGSPHVLEVGGKGKEKLPYIRSDLHESLLKKSSVFDDFAKKTGLHGNLEFANICDIYYYFHGKGFFTIFLSRISYVLMMIFGISYACLLVFFLDYSKLFTIQVDLQDCFIYPRGIKLYSFYSIFISSIIMIAIILGLLVKDLGNLWKIRMYYHVRLRIEDAELETIQWSQVVEKIQHSSRDLYYVSPDNIAYAVTKRDNYLVAMVKNQVFRGPGVDPYIQKYYDMINSTLFYSRMFDWAFDNIIFPLVVPQSVSDKHVISNENIHRFPLNQQGTIFELHEISRHEGTFLERINKPSFQEECVKKLNLRLRLVGFIGIFLCPVVVCIIIVYCFFRYTEELRNRPENALASRQWSKYSRYYYRQYNELPHDFEQRLNSSTLAADKYLQQFYKSHYIIIGRLGSFILASFLAVLLVIAFVNERTLLEKILYGKTLIWWVTLLGAALSIFRALTPPRNSYFDPWKYMKEISDKIGMPQEWQSQAHDRSLRDQFSHLYPHRITIFIHEVLGVILFPYFAMFYLPRCSQKIVQFLTSQTMVHPNIGPICSMSFSAGNNAIGSLNEELP